MERNVRIRKAKISDLGEIWNIISACSTKLEKEGYSHWAEYYSEEKVRDMMNEKECYLLIVDEEIIGNFFISNTPPEYYFENEENVDYRQMFADPAADALYGSGLAIHPDHQRKGFSKEFMTFRENLARERNIEFIRTDTRSDNKGWVESFLKQGFKIVGELPDIDHTYVLLEKKLSD